MNKNNLKYLIKKMTVIEKIGQITQLSTSFFDVSGVKATGTASRMNITNEQKWNIGSVLGKLDANKMLTIQQEYLKHNRLGIPLLFMTDVVHGYKTIFPVPLALSCTWDVNMVEKVARVSAKESSSAGYHVTFSPMVDVVRDPRWGRVMESFGEDKLLNGDFGAAMVRGYQQNDLKHPESIISCVKHFAGYGASEAGRDYNTVDISEWSLRNDYFPPFEKALNAGAKMIMAAFNTLNGVPCTANKWLLGDLLRNEWNFEGAIISDWGAVKELLKHGVAENVSDATLNTLKSGLNIEMMTTAFFEAIPELIEKNEMIEKYLDEAVEYVLNLKLELGLFEDPFRGVSEQREEENILHPNNRNIARKVARKSMVLLKNDGMLPLFKHEKIALIGPYAQDKSLLGPWSIDGNYQDVVSIYDGLVKKGAYVHTLDELTYHTIADNQISAAKELVRKSDKVVLALGESEEMSGEAGSIADIGLPSSQLHLLNEVAKCGKPITLVLINGRPLDLVDVVPKVNAILEAWFPGVEGGNAIADIVMGDYNPAGKLTMSFPYRVGQIPIYYNHQNTGRPKEELLNEPRYKSQYLDIPNEPLYPFGYGLSFTKFKYGSISLSSNKMTKDEQITVDIQITNQGSIPGTETVQLYIQDRIAEVARPIKELASYQQVQLQPGESKTVTFSINEQMLRYPHTNHQVVSDPGEFIIYVGPDSSVEESARIILSE
ncbi:glycoside hydrolase family 3 C-terminal domain-containing protein [Oceanobacillus jeddahense]|uniref:beta-glucosidase n=1 Tax=Oceanobacillus jeddahense TaxID=1462527 RepID=A0ABY5JTR5_9BACI|nr:glycoside hydrolase family 3 N-terminal domain-containing protein [Oceanobacillus jeddahense]UUI03725.1 glycoside hydrolase family 3 C-terminal domain-containing protein [Oceanobacillus jeddahense]